MGELDSLCKACLHLCAPFGAPRNHSLVLVMCWGIRADLEPPRSLHVASPLPPSIYQDRWGSDPCPHMLQLYLRVPLSTPLRAVPEGGWGLGLLLRTPQPRPLIPFSFFWLR